MHRRPLKQISQFLLVVLSLAVVFLSPPALSIGFASASIFVQQGKLTASDGAVNDRFGYLSVSADGNTLVAGAPIAKIGNNTNQGAAYLYTKPTTGWTSTSTFIAKLTASDGTANNYFGFSVSISEDGNTVVVGAYGLTGNASQGAAYVFVKPITGWTTTSAFTAKLTSSDGAFGNRFGSSVFVSGDGNTVVVGEPSAAIGSNTGQGAAYVFVKPTTGWVTMTETAKLTASDGAANNAFGDSVFVSGDGNTVMVGADGRIGGNISQGAAYVFVKPTTGWATASETAKLTASDGVANDAFGSSVFISADGNTIAVGAILATIGSNTNQGSAYVFLKPTTGWATTSSFAAKLTNSDGTANNYLGFSASISGDGNTVVVGAGLPASSISRQGASYVFVKPTTGWTTMTQSAKLTASDGTASDGFGTSVSISSDGNTLAVGAPSAKIGSNASQGAAYIFASANAIYLPLIMR